VTPAAPREFLLDVSRLIWRVWRRRLPTGIDRVCLEYVKHFGSRSQAVIQRKGSTFVLSPKHSDRLFSLILEAPSNSRSAFIALGATAWTQASRSAPREGMIYLNVGHTGLDDPALPTWISKNAARAVYLIHDLIPLTHPEFCRPGEAAKHRRRMENALSSASGIIGNSQATLDELAAFASAKGLPMPPTLAAWISGPRAAQQISPRTLERPYFVTLGTIEGRKNHILLLQIWRRLIADLGDKAPILLIIGQRGWEAGPAIAMLDRMAELHGHVRELSRCGDEELAAWLSGARALLMPSLAEGFGLPIIEAFEAGTPVIASDLPVYREIVGDIPTYLDPLDGLGWERTIRAFTGDDPERERQKAVVAGYRPPDWPSHFEAVEKWLKAL
jgi:glycosyltransferase involved in cell wall biosynthesis